MSEIGSVSKSLCGELTNLLKPKSTTQSIANDSKGLQLQDFARIDDNSESVENLVIKKDKTNTYYEDLKNSSVLKKEETPKTRAEASKFLVKTETKQDTINSYYQNLEKSGVLKNIGNSTTAELSKVIASAVGNGMSVQDACNIKNGITAYENSDPVQNPVAVEVDV